VLPEDTDLVSNEREIILPRKEGTDRLEVGKTRICEKSTDDMYLLPKIKATDEKQSSPAHWSFANIPTMPSGIVITTRVEWPLIRSINHLCSSL
jgi:hypothetical protein